MKSIDDISAQAADAYVARDMKMFARRLGEVALVLDGDADAVVMTVIRAFAKKAGEARRRFDHSVVCRLMHGAYELKPTRIPRREIRELLVQAGAAGPLPKDQFIPPMLTSRTPRYSMVYEARG